MVVLMAWLFLEQRGDNGAVGESETRRADDVLPTPREAIVCSQCHHEVTDRSHRTRRAGEHEHTFANPHGFFYTIGCFADAPGCEVSGAPSDEFSWFAGYLWQITACSGCKTHLGWHFTCGPNDAFYGLILNRLVFQRGGA